MKKFLSILAVLVFTIFAFVGCAKDNFVSYASAPAIGNGGLAVAKGEYIYFVNGFESKDANLNKNKDGDITTSGIYRIKTSSCSYNIVGSTLHFNIKDIPVDENGNLIGAELIISKVCGFENTAIYIFGDYIYYTTPNNEVAKNGEPYVNDIDFCKARIDGKQNTKLGTIKNINSASYSSIQVGFYSVGEDVLFACFNGESTLSVHKINKFKANEILNANGVSNVTLPSIVESFNGQVLSNVENSIYYLSNNKLCSFNFISQTIAQHRNIFTGETLNIIGNNGNYLFYSISKNNIQSIYRNNFSTVLSDGEKMISNTTSYTGFKIIDGSDNILALSEKNISLIGVSTILKTFNVISSDSETTFEIVKTFDRNIFYLTENKLYKVNLFEESPTSTVLINAYSKNANTVNNISFANNYLFYFETNNGTINLIGIDYKNLSSSGEIQKSYTFKV